MLLASTVPPSESGGMGNVQRNLMEGMRQRGVMVSGYFPASRSVIAGDLLGGWGLARKARGFDVVNAHTDISWRLDGAVRTLHGVSARCAVELEADAAYSLMPVGRHRLYLKAHSFMEGLCAGRNRFIAVSDFVRKNAMEFYGIDDRNIRTVYNGIGAGRFKPDPAAGRKFRKQFGIPQGIRLATWLGHLEFNKGIKYFIDVMNGLDDGFAFALRGPMTREDLLARGLDEAALDRVFIIPKVDSIAGFYNAGDVHVLSSVYEPFCLTALEAMACGKPVAAFRSGGHDEVINSSNGRLVANRDSAGLARAVRQASAPGASARLGKAARKAILGGFTSDHMVENTLSHFNGLLDSGGPGRG